MARGGALGQAACRDTGAATLEIPITEAETRLGELLDRVEAGEEVIITRDGRAAARLAPPVPGALVIDAAARARALEAVEGIREMSRGVTLRGLSIRELIDEGRR